MGITLREVIFGVGGGIAGDKKFKAVQLGGPSGGCIPESLLEVQVDYDSLTATGAIMGSGGMVVMDESTCMVDVARYFLSFTQSESCGKCTFCRMGTKRMLETLERICGGQGRMSDIDLLQELARQGAPGLPVRAGADRAQPGAHHPAVLPGGVRRAHPREALPGQTVPGPDPLPRDSRDLHGLHGLRQGLPDPGRRGRTKESAYDHPGQVHPVRPVLPGLPVRRHRGAHRSGGGRRRSRPRPRKAVPREAPQERQPQARAARRSRSSARRQEAGARRRRRRSRLPPKQRRPVGRGALRRSRPAHALRGDRAERPAPSGPARADHPGRGRGPGLAHPHPLPRPAPGALRLLLGVRGARARGPRASCRPAPPGCARACGSSPTTPTCGPPGAWLWS